MKKKVNVLLGALGVLGMTLASCSDCKNCTNCTNSSYEQEYCTSSYTAILTLSAEAQRDAAVSSAETIGGCTCI